MAIQLGEIGDHTLLPNITPLTRRLSSRFVSHTPLRLPPSAPHRLHPFRPVDMNTERPAPAPHPPAPAPHPPGIDIGIALFRRTENEYSYTHWALVSVERTHNYRDTPVHSYQISNRDASGAKVPWFTNFSHDVMLSGDPTIIGIVHLGTVDMPQNQLDEFIAEMGAGQNAYNTRGLGWSNKTFITHIVGTLCEAGMLRLPSAIGRLESDIQEVGVKMELVRHWGGESLPTLNL